MNNYRLEIVNRTEAHTGNDLACLHVMIDNNSNKEIADTYIPLDDVQRAIKEHKAAGRAADIAARRSQGAKDGWEIRRGKQGGTPTMRPPSKQRLINGRLVTVQRLLLKCGKSNCICHTNPEKRHGPYWKGFWRENGRMKSVYIGKTLPEEARGEG